ncbi:ABC transporter ATP-binding protein [Salinicoccus sp. ID82-1]|uniref:ABC transporter ATP-binding protein n=1 Tax=Salinicoccus sp. ID82-1 TaxID=2820269 RepID=UPI001F482E40|nr:ABC transporter ATP-binding protein [Salinicoccus sp. ID82-1]MCG1010659.1 ABC transporter ATP-binding protein [Salinicoccus sp. ID82-1]
MKNIEMTDITKSYDKQKNVLNEINLTIGEGEFFVLVGPSGSGKSTLLRMIAGLEDITDGIMKIDDRVVNHLPPKDRDLSMVFQNYALYPHMSVEQNILFGLQAKKVGKEEQRRRLIETTDMMGLGDYLKRKPRELSGGQRQRVALARAVVSQAPVCLMDEPLSNLDAKLRASMRVEIRRLQKRLGLTMVYVTHDQVEAMTMGDRIMVLHDGSIQQVGNPIELYNEPANLFVASFIGSPKMNLGKAVLNRAEGRLIVEDELNINASESLMSDIPNDASITVGIRAEHLTYATKEDATHFMEAVNVENLGNETTIAFELNNEIWTAKWPGQWEIEVGEMVPVKISCEDLAIFDTGSGRLIRAAKRVSKGAVPV